MKNVIVVFILLLASVTSAWAAQVTVRQAKPYYTAAMCGTKTVDGCELVIECGINKPPTNEVTRFPASKRQYSFWLKIKPGDKALCRAMAYRISDKTRSAYTAVVSYTYRPVAKPGDFTLIVR